MPERTDLREAIVQALRQFSVEGAARPLACVGEAARPSSSNQQGQAAPATFPAAARAFFATLGYQSDRRLPITTARQFREQLDPGGKLTDRERETLEQLTSLHLLFQLTGAELDTHGELFDDKTAVQPTRIESYLFFAAELPPGHYTRTALSTLVRAINKPLPMPALVLFRHGDTVSLGIIHRRLSKRDASKDVLEKVTLIKDIACADPIRAHIEILNDFAQANLDADFGVPDFVRLHEAWQKRLGSYALSNDFYREIADWYFWAHHQVEDGAIRLPQHCDTEQEKSLFLIRLLTRVIFCWFLVEKRLIPTDLFREHRLKALLKDFHPSRDPKQPDTAPTYYHAILQNLFFGTLNMPPEQRGFRKKATKAGEYDQNFGITNLWRYESDFRDPEAWRALAARIPFLNGGLFDCLDDKVGGAARPSKSVEGAASPLPGVIGAARPSSSNQQGQAAPDTFTRKILDGFSDNPKLACHLPNDLFFGPERTVDLSRDYGEEDKKTARSKRAKVRGLIEILSRYKFTIEENTPLEEEIALDPELLGKVFENLLASYNEDTRTTARKALGAFYTPREIVSYMVDEALKSYLATQVPRCKGALDDLFSNKATLKEIKPDTRDALIAAIGRVKILDPACGSGAFPMGALHRLVDLLQKLDPNNESWKRDRLAEARRYRQLLEESGAPREELAACDARIADIEKSFDSRYHALDFARKLYLIENSIYGVDIQPIATQIAKLRFFISLVVDQKVESDRGGSPLNPQAPGQAAPATPTNVRGAARPLTSVEGAASPLTKVGGAARPSSSDQQGQAAPATPWNLGIRPLPNLETKFVAADTLIPIEKAESDLFSGAIDRLRAELAAIRHEHFNARSPAAKRKWRDADAAKRAELAAELEKSHALSKESARKLAAWDPYDQNASAPFFDPVWMFGLNRVEGAARPSKSVEEAARSLPSVEGAASPLPSVEGAASPLSSVRGAARPSSSDQQEQAAPITLSPGPFDIVIGNPPYVRQEQLKHLKEHFRKHYDCFTGTADLYVYFYEAGIRLLRPGGTFSFITSNKWFRAAYGEKLRAWLTRHTRVLQLIDFGDAPVFTAIAYPCIVIVQRTDAAVEADANVRALTWEPGPAIETFAEVFQRKSFALPQRELKPDGWRLESGATLRLLERLRQAGKPLGEYVNGRFYRGVLTGLNEAFVVDRATRDRLIAEHPSSAEVLKPFLRGRDIKRWRVEPPDLWLIFTRRGINIKNFPAIYEHLLPFKKRLMPGAPGGRKPGSYQWYEIQDNIAYWQEFERPKVLYPDIYEHQSFTWDEAGHFAANTCYFIPTSEKWFTGLLNSTAVEWFYGNISNRVRGGYLRAFSDYMKEIPIPAASAKQQATIEGLVDHLLFLHRHLADHPETASTRDPLMVAYFEQILNGLVYELYFPEELHAAGLRLFDLVEQSVEGAASPLPSVEGAARPLPSVGGAARPSSSDQQGQAAPSTFLPTLRAKFEELYDARHPLKVALEKLANLETVRIIEGKA